VEEHSGPGTIGDSDRDTPAEDAQRHTSPYLDALFAPRADPPNGIALEDIVALRIPHSCLIYLTGGTCEVKLTEERLEATKRAADLAQEKLDRTNKRATALTAAISILKHRVATRPAENRRTLAVDVENLRIFLELAGEDASNALDALTTENGAVRGPKEISRSKARKLLRAAAIEIDEDKETLDVFSLSRQTLKTSRTMSTWLDRAEWSIEELRAQARHDRKRRNAGKSN
jgi:hypothetical protein